MSYPLPARVERIVRARLSADARAVALQDFVVRPMCCYEYRLKRCVHDDTQTNRDIARGFAA